MLEKRFELIIFDEEENEEFVDRKEFSELDERFKKYGDVESLYNSLKNTKNSYLGNTHLILEKSTMKIVEIGEPENLGDF